MHWVKATPQLTNGSTGVVVVGVVCEGEMFARRMPGACPARYLCINYLISSPKFILTLGSPPGRPH